MTAYFSDSTNLETIDRLKAAGLQFQMKTEHEKLSDSLAGKTIVISGNFSISRDEMKTLIAAHGGKNSSSISGRTSYLLAGEKSGPEKMKKAIELGVKVLNEKDFRTIIGEEASDESQEAFSDTLF